jgi:hypothetical protein
MAARTLIHIPPNPRRGEAVEVRATIRHPMETGYRPDAEGRVMPRDIVTGFHAGFDDMSPALQALQRDDTQNPGQLWVREGEALWSRVPGEPWAPGADEWLALEVYLARRAAGLAVETPAVRP